MEENMNSLDFTKKLVSIPTISSDSNLELIEYVAAFLKSQGIESIIQRNDENTKANLIATVGPRDEPGLILSGHTDVVPVEGQNWRQDPFAPWIEGDYLYGRGCADMKGFIACVLACVPFMRQAKLKRPVHIFLSYDEEIGCMGAKELAKAFTKQYPKDQLACIVGEPSDLQVINAHKGVRMQRTVVTGPTGHSSVTFNMCNALVIMSKLILFLEKYALDTCSKTNEGPYRHFNSCHNTINPGLLKAGTAVNIVPEKAELLWEYRVMPETDEDEIFNAFIAYAKQLEQESNQAAGENLIQITTESVACVPALSAAHNQSLTDYMMSYTNNSIIGQVDFGAEAGIFQNLIGVPTVICGPGSIKQAHRVDEFVEIDQLFKMEEILKKVVTDVCCGERVDFKNSKGNRLQMKNVA